MWYRNKNKDWINIDKIKKLIVLPDEFTHPKDEKFQIKIFYNKSFHDTIEDEINSEEEAQEFLDLMMAKLLDKKYCTCEEIEKELGWDS